MTIATALVTANDPLPQLGEEAVQQALAKAGLTHANGVLLFLTPEFSRHAQQTVTAVARKSQCTQVVGGIASGVFTEAGWALDRPAAAVMIFGGGLSLGHPEPGQPIDHPLFSYAGGAFPNAWAESGTRFGSTFAGSFAGSATGVESLAWQQSRLAVQQHCSAQLLGTSIAIDVSSGLKPLGEPLVVDRSNGYDLERLGGQAALKTLMRLVPPEFRQHIAQHLHHLSAVLIEHGGQDQNWLAAGCYRPIAIIAVNADSSLTLAERVAPGQQLAWAIRQPVAAEADMRQTIERLTARPVDPVCALVFSCIGRGPYFYGGEDRDLDVLRARFPGLPLLGTYGTGQIAPMGGTGTHINRQWQNAVVTALVSRESKEDDVQSVP